MRSIPQRKELRVQDGTYTAMESKSAKSHIARTVSRGNTSKKEVATEISYLGFV